MKQDTQEHVVELLEKERRRLARDIHDGPAQYLTNASMRIEIVKKLLESGRMDESFGELDKLQGLLRTAVNDVRRMIFDLRPTFLERGVHDAILLYGERFSQLFDIPVEVDGDWQGVELPRSVEISLFRIYQEALNNVHKHARATSIRVTLKQSVEICSITIVDDGVGFDDTVPARGSYGLQGIRERLTLAGGKLEIYSKLGQGTKLYCEVERTHG